MKRRGISLLLALVMLASLAACGSQKKEDAERPEEAITAEETTGAPQEAPEGGGTQDGADQEPENSQSEPAPYVDLTAFYETLGEGDEEWPAMMETEGEVLGSFYPGLSDIAANQCVVYTAMISATVGEIALVEVQNADDVQKVKDIFQARIDYQVGDENNPGGAWYPDTIEGWKSGSRIVSHGNYVMLAATYEKSDDIVSAFNGLFA